MIQNIYCIIVLYCCNDTKLYPRISILYIHARIRKNMVPEKKIYFYNGKIIVYNFNNEII
ncbi:hypothetical protein PFNF135_03257 [Plasmodium falciparum NF135/5.C10]|uniref:Uncharacterized protein n=1 Tax=Plasmodium falciparum NF135/5.C10 TaxID=1036726 RepID=W4IH47_PLAFA|nr:hypothetical protein PFNF135_03257 [Plasmodium falciparum NF135/5.C10]